MHAKRYLCTRYIFLLTHTTLRMKHTFLFALLLALFLPLPMQAEIKRIQVSGENLTPVTFNSDTLYSRWIINSRLGSYANKSKSGSPRLRGFGFASPYGITKATADDWDYVPGLVARAVLDAIECYKDSAFSQPWLAAIDTWATNKAKGQTLFSDTKKDDIDWLNAAKVFSDLYRLKKYSWCQDQMTNAVLLLKNKHARIGMNGKADYNSAQSDAIGGFFHKGNYPYQMWCDGQYMGPAMWAEWLGVFQSASSYTEWENDWKDIANQLDIVCRYTYSPSDKLFFHGMTAALSTNYTWTPVADTFHSQEAWGRGAGWLFAALVDILEFMPAGIDVRATFTYPDGKQVTNVDSRTRLLYYLTLMADGLAKRQDPSTHCWTQLLRYDNGTIPSGATNPNYIESSASSMFVYAYLKAIRLGLLTGTTTDKSGATVTYKELAKRGFEGVVTHFICKQSKGDIQIIQSCESAGLDGGRPGNADYYLGNNNDTRINDASEGKALGPFILAAVEYERAYMVVQTTTRPPQNTVSRTYTADNTTNFSNPERGFYEHIEQVVTADGTSNLSDHYFSDGRTKGHSLLLRLYYLDNFCTEDLPQAVLNEIATDMAKFRTNGFKCILRFAYTAKAYENASQNQDASPAIWQQHLSQLKPVLQANADVIYVVQAGFLGAWGEWYYSSQGIGSAIPQDTKRNLINWLLDAVPANRCVQLRTPKFKTDYIGNTTVLTDATAYQGTPQARLGHHNDAFCNGELNQGTYENATTDKDYIAQECLYVPNGGETNITDDNTYTKYGTGEKAAAEMKLLRYSYLNHSYSTHATDKWKAEKDASSGSSYYDIMARQMGYRFVLTDGTYPTQATAGKNMHISLKINNTGYAPLYNERHAYIVLKNDTKTYSVQLLSDPRSWRPDQTTTITEDLPLPAEMVAGTYALYLHLPDADSRIAANPAYAVRLANTDIWDSATGYNSLNTQITIAPATPQQENTASCNCLNLTFL